MSGFGAAKHVSFINYILFSRVMISLFLCSDKNDPLHRQHQSAELQCCLIQLITFFGCFLRMAEAMKASSARNSTIKAKPARSERASRRKPKDTPTPTPTLDTKEFGNFIAFRASACPGLLSDDINIFGCGVERMSVGDMHFGHVQELLPHHRWDFHDHYSCASSWALRWAIDELPLSREDDSS